MHVLRVLYKITFWLCVKSTPEISEFHVTLMSYPWTISLVHPEIFSELKNGHLDTFSSQAFWIKDA